MSDIVLSKIPDAETTEKIETIAKRYGIKSVELEPGGNPEDAAWDFRQGAQYGYKLAVEVLRKCPAMKKIGL